ncbi:hypothetical protein [Streptomyces rhizosphaerihabitans]|uniref:hypothetical protein n=1 Tax=Streptomyces rhizosphaerihabitans TaxID=1266770 RepID=UPI0021BF8644|nr:hypothetical protein [Streptomyces rhizosphaerihabitans]MCT9010979.1 hypothetical protein [Streptomyces rhizosphaerihabitans]
MRYLTESFALGALRRGRPIEQFLGPAGSPERPGIRYIELRPAKIRYEIYLHTLEDVGHETFVDVVEFPPLCTDDEEEEFGRLVATHDEPLAALATAEDITGAARGRWVNAGLVQDEYHDYVVAGRPANSSPDGNPWPVPPPGL